MLSLASLSSSITTLEACGCAVSNFLDGVVIVAAEIGRYWRPLAPEKRGVQIEEPNNGQSWRFTGRANASGH
jgi:hypothetical protein